MSTFRAKARPDEIPANDPQNELLPCNRCGTATPRHVLSRTGALCVQCYEDWRREAPAGSALTPNQRVELLKRMVGKES